MGEFLTIREIDQAVHAIRARIKIQPEVGMILGSGLGPMAETIEDAVIIPTDQIPNWPISTVVGHEGRLVIGRLEGVMVLVLQGRAHFYEGYDIGRVTLPVANASTSGSAASNSAKRMIGAKASQRRSKSSRWRASRIKIGVQP